MKDKESECERLVKIIAEAGIASRRKCEKIIESGRVRVNNNVVTDPAYKVNEKDTVSVDREIIGRETKHYIALYKPLGVVSTTKRLPGRRVITEFFKDIKERLFYAGRLDSESRGIMIITNDGEFANIITHPSYEVLKVYDVTVNSKVETERILKASYGVTIKSIKYSAFKFKVLSKGRLQSKIRLTINEGKNREIRKIFEYLGYKVIDLERISVGCVSKFHPDLGTLEAGHIRVLTEEEINFFFNKKKEMYKNISAENIDDFDFSLAEDELSAKEAKEERDENKYKNRVSNKEGNKEDKSREHTRKKKVKKHNKALWAKPKIKPGRVKSGKLKLNKKISASSDEKIFGKSFNSSDKKSSKKIFGSTSKKSFGGVSKKTFNSSSKKSFSSASGKSSKNIYKKVDSKFKKTNSTKNPKTKNTFNRKDFDKK